MQDSISHDTKLKHLARGIHRRYRPIADEKVARSSKLGQKMDFVVDRVEGPRPLISGRRMEDK